MAPPADSFPLARAEAVLLDGANSVGGHHRPSPESGTASSLFAVVAAVVVLWWWRRRRPAWLLPVLMLAAAVPGALGVLVLRADAPLARPATARVLLDALDTLERQAPWPGTPVRVEWEDDDVLFPLGRYAWPSRAAAAQPFRLELRGTTLRATCRPLTTGDGAVCGGAP